jgi:hypothetical protein
MGPQRAGAIDECFLGDGELAAGANRSVVEQVGAGFDLVGDGAGR